MSRKTSAFCCPSCRDYINCHPPDGQRSARTIPFCRGTSTAVIIEQHRVRATNISIRSACASRAELHLRDGMDFPDCHALSPAAADVLTVEKQVSRDADQRESLIPRGYKTIKGGERPGGLVFAELRCHFHDD